MSVEPFAPDETAPIEPIEPIEPTDGIERPVAPFTSEIRPAVQGVADALGNTGFDESEKSDPV